MSGKKEGMVYVTSLQERIVHWLLAGSCLFALFTGLGLSAFGAITGFGLVVAGFMWQIQRWHARNLRAHREEVEHLLALAREDQPHG